MIISLIDLSCTQINVKKKGKSPTQELVFMFISVFIVAFEKFSQKEETWI